LFSKIISEPMALKTFRDRILAYDSIIQHVAFSKPN
jgi:hypothetical protein